MKNNQKQIENENEKEKEIPFFVFLCNKNEVCKLLKLFYVQFL
jgi:hypothetical protein